MRVSLGYHSTKSTPQSFTYLCNYVKGVDRFRRPLTICYSIHAFNIIVMTLKNYSKKFKARAFIPSSVCGIVFHDLLLFSEFTKDTGN